MSPSHKLEVRVNDPYQSSTLSGHMDHRDAKRQQVSERRLSGHPYSRYLLKQEQYMSVGVLKKTNLEILILRGRRAGAQCAQLRVCYHFPCPFICLLVGKVSCGAQASKAADVGCGTRQLRCYRHMTAAVTSSHQYAWWVVV